MEPYEIEFYRSGVLRKWRWRARCLENGLITGMSSQSYWNRGECEYNAKRLGESLTAATKDL